MTLAHVCKELASYKLAKLRAIKSGSVVGFELQEADMWNSLTLLHLLSKAELFRRNHVCGDAKRR